MSAGCAGLLPMQPAEHDLAFDPQARPGHRLQQRAQAARGGLDTAQPARHQLDQRLPHRPAGAGHGAERQRHARPVLDPQRIEAHRRHSRHRGQDHRGAGHRRRRRRGLRRTLRLAWLSDLLRGPEQVGQPAHFRRAAFGFRLPTRRRGDIRGPPAGSRPAELRLLQHPPPVGRRDAVNELRVGPFGRVQLAGQEDAGQVLHQPDVRAQLLFGQQAQLPLLLGDQALAAREERVLLRRQPAGPPGPRRLRAHCHPARQLTRRPGCVPGPGSRPQSPPAARRRLRRNAR